MNICYLLLIYDAVHNAMMVVLYACIHASMVRSQPKPKIVRCMTGSTKVHRVSTVGSTEYGKPTLDLQVALSALVT